MLSAGYVAGSYRQKSLLDQSSTSKRIDELLEDVGPDSPHLGQRRRICIIRLIERQIVIDITIISLDRERRRIDIFQLGTDLGQLDLYERSA